MAISAPTIAAVAAVVGAGASVVGGVTSHSAAIKSRQQQRGAQQASTLAAAEAQRKADEATAQANKKGPDIGSLLTAEQEARMNGATSLLTSPGGPKTKKPTLGGPSLLGEV